MRDFKDYYAILGVAPHAATDEIAQAWRRGCFRWHPDRNRGREDEAHEHFLEIGEAFGVLSDARARARYDRLRERRLPDAATPTGGKAAEEEGLSVFERTLRDACRTQSSSSGVFRDARAFERMVLKVMRELADARIDGREVTRLEQILHLAAMVLSFVAAALIAISLAADPDFSTLLIALVAAPLPLVTVTAVMRVWMRAARDRREAESLRPVAESIVRRRQAYRA